MFLTNDDLSELFSRHRDELYRWLRRAVGDRQSALDLVGETFAMAVRGRNDFRGESLDDAGAWLRGIARVLVVKFHQRGFAERETMTRLGLERVVIESDPTETLSNDEARASMGDSLAQLKPEYRQAILMRYY